MMAIIHFCDMCGEPFDKGEVPYIEQITHGQALRTMQDRQRCTKRELCAECTDKINLYVEAYRRGTR